MGSQIESGGQRIGVFGGTFDPPHNEHLMAAIEVRSALELDRVLLVVANRPWQKAHERSITDARVRLEMVQAATRGLSGIEASDLEIRRGGDSFTVDTVEELQRSDAEAALFVVVGADVEPLIPTWKSVDRLRESATLVVVTRSGIGYESGPEDNEPWCGIERVEIPRIDVSGTELRARVAAGRGVDELCPPGVVEIIERRGLYRDVDR